MINNFVFESAKTVSSSSVSIGDKASIAIAIASYISALIILIQAIAMGIQTKYSNRLIEIELKRDRQANLISSWIEVASWVIRTRGLEEGQTSSLNGYLQVVLLNQSSLPIYNVRPHYIGFWNQEKEFLFYEKNYFLNAEMNVLPPGRGEQNWFGIDVKNNSVSLRIGDELYGDVFLLDQSNLTQDDAKKLGISFRFRCSDGTEWERRIDGTLEPILNMDVF